MNSSKPFLYAIIFILASSSVLVSQKRIAVYNIEIKNDERKEDLIALRIKYENDRLLTVPEKIINYFSNDDDFIIIDRKNENLVHDERELQKSEEFMDGYIVEQGRAEGANLLCYSSFDENEKILTINIYDVESGEVFCSKETELNSNMITGIQSIEYELAALLQEISVNCFDKGFLVVRMTKEKKGKAKEILVLIGTNQRVKLNYILEVYKIVEEDLQGKKIKRRIVIGEAYISEIEDENFSRLRITKGQKEIFKALESGIKLQSKLLY